MSCICFEVLLRTSSQDTSKKHNLYSECVQNKAVKRDCHLKEATAFTFVLIRLIRVR
jgi:hypothetical protein